MENDIFYISKKGKVACDSIKGLAKDTDFYKISLLNNKDIEFIKNFSSKSPLFLQEIHLSHLDDFVTLSNISRAISKAGYDSEELSSIKKVIQHNSLENLHSFIEDHAVEVISNLAQGNSECLKSKENMMAFCSYIGHQISRTKAFKEKSIEAVNSNTRVAYPEQFLELFEKNWWFLSFMFGLSIGFSLYESKDRDNHVFITNDTSHPFITSDHPIINMHSSLASLPERQAPDNADFYIPLSPQYAYMINNSPDFNHLANSLDINDVIMFNETIAKKSYRTIFGSNEAVLKKYNKHFN